MEDFVTDQLAAGYAHSSLESRLYDLSSMFQWLRKRDYSDINPIAHEDFESKLESGDKYEDIRYIDVEEFEAIMDVVEKPRDKLLLSILWDTGVRSEEIVSIYTNDLERDEQKITLKTAKQQGEREKKRPVFYTRRTERLLSEYIDRGARRDKLSHAESPYLFIGEGVEQLNERRPTELVREYAEMAGVQSKVPVPDAQGNRRRKVTAHCFRHSFAVHRVKRGMPIVYLSDLLGHKDVEQTRVYLKFREDDLKEAYRKYLP
ncbi:MAG: tyrosine-type recombinase/integrase [Halobacteriaceae archaeon]